jgi:hypothetical protein
MKIPEFSVAPFSARTTRRRFLGTAATGVMGLWLAACDSTERVRPVVPETEPPDAPPKEAWRLRAEESIRRAADWLWDQQRKNGVFPSSTYGLMRDGQSLTPFSLLALLQIDPQLYPLPFEKSGKALVRMVTMSMPAGALGMANATLDYPCYSTGMMLTCLGLLKPDGWAQAADLSATWLRGQQFRSAAGWKDHPAQGGWGLGSRTKRVPPDAGHVDLSMTRVVLEGLRAAKIPPGDPTIAEAADFVARCQTPDGSFVYSPVELALNKGVRGEDGRSRGYGSATTDGLLAWIALGRAGDDSALRSAAEWLRLHHRVDRNPGLDGSPMEAFALAMRGYYRAGAAECFMLTGGPAGWREELCEALGAEQRPDGSWKNDNPLQKEDDPIIATGFAIRSLAAALRQPRA